MYVEKSRGGVRIFRSAPSSGHPTNSIVECHVCKSFLVVFQLAGAAAGGLPHVTAVISRAYNAEPHAEQLILQLNMLGVRIDVG